METRAGGPFGGESEHGRGSYGGFETRGGMPSDVEQRGIRFPASWQPDATPERSPSMREQTTARPESTPGFFGSSCVIRENDQPREISPVSASRHTPERSTIQLMMTHQFLYSMAALAVAAVCMGIGGWLAYSGAVGKTSFAAHVLSDFGLKVQMTDAGPGCVLFVVALLAMIATRYNVRVDK